MIEKHFLSTGMNPFNAVFDPIPSYSGDWLFTIDNLRKNVKDKKLWDEFYKITYEEPLEKLFQTKRILDLQVGMISKPNKNNVGRCLSYNKVDFFVGLTSFLNQHIDNHGLSEKEKNERIISLINHIKDTNENLNLAYSEALKMRASRLKDVLDKGFNSEYFEASMKDYEPYKSKLSFEEYIKSNYEITSKFQVGMLKLGNFFDKNIDFNKLYELFDPDIFCLLFAKIIYEFNLKREKESNSLDNSYSYLCHYKMMVDKVVEEDKKYDPKILYTLDNGKKIRYSRWNFMSEYHELMNRHPEAGSFKLPVLEDGSDDRYKDISLMEKLTKLYKEDTKVNWEFLPEGEGIKRGESKNSESTSRSNKKDKEKLIQEVNMRISILENSGFIGRPVKGLNTFSGYYAFIYPNGKVILEKFWESEQNLNPSVGAATYVMSIDNFVEMSKISRINLIEYIKTLPEIGVKRIFHTSINNWQRNLYNEINGTYRIEDAIDFINSLNMGDKNMNNSIYKRILEIIIKEKESFDMLISADNILGLNVTSEEVINYLEFASDDNSLSGPILGDVIITEGDILSILKIINDLKNNHGEYILYINDDNLGTITYLVSRANMIYKEFGLDIKIKIDYSDNYNAYINTLVTVVGSEEFIKESETDFSNANHIIV